MRGVNRVMLIGNLGKDPDVQVLEGNIAVAKFPLATTETFKDRGGNWYRKQNGILLFYGEDLLNWRKSIFIKEAWFILRVVYEPAIGMIKKDIASLQPKWLAITL